MKGLESRPEADLRGKTRGVVDVVSTRRPRGVVWMNEKSTSGLLMW